MSAIRHPRLVAFAAVAGLGLLSVGIAVPIANKDDPNTGLVLSGFGVLIGAALLGIGFFDECCGDEKLDDGRVSPPPSEPVPTNPTFRLQYTAAPVGQIVPAVRVVRGIPVVGYGQELVPV